MEIPLSTDQILVQDLIQHFKDMIREYGVPDRMRIFVSYDDMLDYLMKKYDIKFGDEKYSKLYYALTHGVIRSLEKKKKKKKILKRYKAGTRWFFEINNENLK